MPSLLSASFWSFVLNWGQQGIAALVTFVLAAVLGPEQYGLAVIAVSFVILIQSILDQGLMVALIQREDLDDGHLNSVFWALIAFAALSSGLIVAGAGAWADWNSNAHLKSIIWALTPIVFLKCLYLVPHALLRRALDFKRLAFLNNLALIFSSVVAIVTLTLGFGIWSLILYYLTVELSNTLLYWLFTKYRPGLHFSRQKLFSLMPVASGGFVSGFGSFARSRGDIFVMGVLLGPVAVGLFRLALRIQELLLTLFMRPISMVALPALSQAGQTLAQRQKSASDFLQLATGMTVPVMAFAAALSPYLLGLLGQNWLPAASALSILCILGSLNAALFLVPQFLNALGRTWQSAIWLWATSVVTLALMVPLIQLFTDQFDDVSRQLSTLAVFLLVMHLVIALPMGAFMLHRNFKLPPLFLIEGLVRPFFSGIIVYATVRIADIFLVSTMTFGGPYIYFVKLLVLASIGGGTILASIFFVNRQFYDKVVPKLFQTARHALQRLM